MGRKMRDGRLLKNLQEWRERLELHKWGDWGPDQAIVRLSIFVRVQQRGEGEAASEQRQPAFAAAAALT